MSTYPHVQHRLALHFEAMSPAAENKRSEGVDVAGIPKKDFASCAKVGYLVSFILHHGSGFSFLEICCSPKYSKTFLCTA